MKKFFKTVLLIIFLIFLVLFVMEEPWKSPDDETVNVVEPESGITLNQTEIIF